MFIEFYAQGVLGSITSRCSRNEPTLLCEEWNKDQTRERAVETEPKGFCTRWKQSHPRNLSFPGVVEMCKLQMGVNKNVIFICRKLKPTKRHQSLLSRLICLPMTSIS